jgi:hypothetical protein
MSLLRALFAFLFAQWPNARAYPIAITRCDASRGDNHVVPQTIKMRDAFERPPHDAETRTFVMFDFVESSREFFHISSSLRRHTQKNVCARTIADASAEDHRNDVHELHARRRSYGRIERDFASSSLL